MGSMLIQNMGKELTHLCMHPYFVMVSLLACPEEHVRSYIVSTPDEYLRNRSNLVRCCLKQLVQEDILSSISSAIVPTLAQLLQHRKDMAYTSLSALVPSFEGHAGS